MKKLLRMLVVCTFVLSLSISAIAFASNEIKVVVDGEYVEFDVQPQLINDRTMVPLRAIFEALGATVDWNEATQTVTATKDIEVIATIGNTRMYVDGSAQDMDVAPILIDDRALVPVRFVAEAFDCDVEWNEESAVVKITSSDETNYYYSDQD